MSSRCSYFYYKMMDNWTSSSALRVMGKMQTERSKRKRWKRKRAKRSKRDTLNGDAER